MKTVISISLAAACLAIAGCEALNDYDRTLSAGANVNTQTGYIAYSIKGAPAKGQGRLSGEVRIEGSLAEGKQVVRLEH